jgi:hypothetical protein
MLIAFAAILAALVGVALSELLHYLERTTK